MTFVSALPVSALSWRCAAEELGFETTRDLEDLEGFLGQGRALEAVQFGIGMRRDGYNLYVLGPPGFGKRAVVQAFLEQQARQEPTPADWCYVNHFSDPQRPRSLKLPPGRGADFVEDMNRLIEDLRASITAALEMEEHKSRIQEVEQEAKEQHSGAFEQLAQQALEHGIQLVRTPAGFALAPIRDGEVLSPDEFEKLSEEERQQIHQRVESLQQELQSLIEKVPRWRRELREKVKALNREVVQFTVANLLQPLKDRYADLPQVLAYLQTVEQDVVANAEELRRDDDEEHPLAHLSRQRRRERFAAYRINLIVDNRCLTGAPVIYEEHPSFQNLLGRVEHESHQGTLETDFTLIRPGALHRANGGYLVIEALRLIQQPYAWEALKRCLYARHVRIVSLAESLSLISTVTLEPQPIPLDVKVVLLGDRLLYYLLYQYDRDFAELFKVAADFDEQMDRTPENCRLYARLIATLIRREKLRAFDGGAVARVLEHSARVAGDSLKLTTHMRTVVDLIREADHWAARTQQSTVAAEHVQEAIEKQVYRADRLRQHIQEEIARGTLLIDTAGSRVGQVNGLSVIDLGNFAFGRPSRITATMRLGKGEVIDIEREVELGGPLHSKGVLILSALLASRYAQNHPLSLSASLVFEQSYGLVDGDSASVAEFCALVSMLSGMPIRQSLAVTGSVNQFGTVQPIGGVNEKIEGFFDVCRHRTLTGDQGVLIPASNVKHLMLRHDVVQAADAGRFHIYPVETVDQALSLLTGVEAGEADAAGQYPAGSVNYQAAARLLELFRLRQQFSLEAQSRPPS